MAQNYLCQTAGMSCVGCCIVGITSNGDLIKAVRNNTYGYKKFISGNPVPEEKEKYFNRWADVVNEPEICTFLVFLDETEAKVGCSAHPCIQGLDYRKRFNTCFADYVCEQSKAFAVFPEQKRESIAKNLQSKYNGDWISLSLDMESGKIEL